MMSNLNNKKPITIVLFGRTGVGKSCLANEIMGKSLFSVGHSLASQTDSVASETFAWPLDPSIQVKIVDTPGFADNRPDMTNAELLSRILNFLKSLEDGLHIAVFCISAKTRIDKHDTQELEMLSLLLGKEMFDHVCIAVTQANTLIPEQRKHICENFIQDLPMIFMENGLPPFTQDRILFADHDRLQENFLEPMTEMIRTTTSYVPQIAEDIDPSDPRSIEVFLAKPEVKEMMLKYEAMAAEQKERIEGMQKIIETQAAENEEKALVYQQQLEVSHKNLQKVTEKLEGQEIKNEKIREQYEKFQEEERKKLDALNQNLLSVSSKNDGLQKMVDKYQSEISSLNTKIGELKDTRASQPQPQPQVVHRDRSVPVPLCNIF